MPRSPSRLTIVPLVVLVGIALTGCSSGSSKQATVSPLTATQAPAPTTDATTTAPTSDTATGSSLQIANFTYDPTPLTVAPGTTIPVKNTDGAEHTVTSDLAGLFKADDVKTGKTVSFKAPIKPGTYTFHCDYHARMHGTLIVK
ncbi:MAG: plastocyanin [Frankiales bacterium]|nr:plastocyanin [Frankiales bacterium]